MNNFPWYYFLRTIRARIILVILASTLTYIICVNYTEYIFSKVLIVMAVLSTFSIVQGVLKILPLGKTLAKIDQIQIDLPHDKKLGLIYQKNEWVLIQEMLGLTEKYILEQKEKIKTQKIQSNTIIESIPQPIIWVDYYFNSLQYNKSFKQSFVQGEDTKVLYDEKLWKIFEQKEILDLFEKSKQTDTVHHLKGILIKGNYYDIAVTPIISTDKEHTGLLGIFHNVSEAKLTEKMRVDFVANVSHEIRTPLTSIKGFSQLLLAKKEDTPPELHTSLERIVTNSEKLEDLFTNLLKLSVIEAQYEIRPEEFELKPLISSISANLKGKYKNHNINLAQKVSGKIFADKKLFEHAVTNLLDNSIKYAEKESVEIKIEFNNHEMHSELSIKDNGPGIGSSDIDRIFERFYRVKGEAKLPKADGSGLGLSIVKHIINKHRGKIKVKSEVGKGTEFTIFLPTV